MNFSSFWLIALLAHETHRLFFYFDKLLIMAVLWSIKFSTNTLPEVMFKVTKMQTQYIHLFLLTQIKEISLDVVH